MQPSDGKICSIMRNPENFPNSEIINPKLDAIVVLGHNLGTGYTGERLRELPDHLSGHSKLSVLAAAILFKEGFTDRIIFSSGHTAGKETISEAEAMRNFMKKKFPEIPDEAIILEEKSIDTAGNAEESIKIVKQLKLSNVGLMSTRDHLKNSTVLFRRYGLNVKQENSFISEEVISRYMLNGHPKNPNLFLKGYRESRQVKGDFYKRELIRKILLYAIDPKGKLLRLKSRTREK